MLSCEFYSQQSQIHPSFKDKTTSQTEKPCRKMKSREKPKYPEGKVATTAVKPPWAARGGHHGLWWTPQSSCGGLWPTQLRRFSNTAFCASFWFAGFVLDLPSWTYWVFYNPF